MRKLDSLKANTNSISTQIKSNILLEIYSNQQLKN